MRDFTPADYPHGVICAACSVPLTTDNAFRRPLRDERQPWEDPAPLVVELVCVRCAVENRESQDGAA